MTPQSDLVTLRQAAAMLCVHYNTILLWTKKGVFRRVVRVGPAKSIRLYRVEVLSHRTEYAA